ncbi:MAG: hypothetical protein CMP16_02490 [Rickettsiales bacterium]|nr:hypothetical protein [Rickettsiales bacterium]|tara:strand:- start:104 stop:391 length:288 start_codon:yes stop_codon:yes gene_type:complete
MTNSFLKFTVIFLAILIFICFAFLLYGLYSKISNTEDLSNEEIAHYSLNLSNSESIKDIKIINENNLLIVVSSNDQIYLIIYNLHKNKIISKIGK